ncbi:hypothetical protein BaRGS_00033065, partial [Batillaria attramentaria]
MDVHKFPEWNSPRPLSNRPLCRFRGPFILSDDEFVQKVEWYFASLNGEATATGAEKRRPKRLAEYNYNFFPSVKMVGRVQYMSNAGIKVKRITTHDVGTYTVRVSLKVNGSSAVEETSAVLSLPDKPVLALGRLHARVSKHVYHDTDTDDFHVQLECGTIVNAGDDNFSVIWK